jgi:hypothetical protein
MKASIHLEGWNRVEDMYTVARGFRSRENKTINDFIYNAESNYKTNLFSSSHTGDKFKHWRMASHSVEGYDIKQAPLRIFVYQMSFSPTHAINASS